jgi:hypothetical protein
VQRVYPRPRKTILNFRGASAWLWRYGGRNYR